MPGPRLAGFLVGAAAAALLAGCSSGGSSNSSSGTAQTERSNALAAAKNLDSQVRTAGVGWSGNISGLYDSCGQADPLAAKGSASLVQYTATELVGAFRSGVAQTVLSRQVNEVLAAGGWKLKPLTVPASPATWYTSQRDGLDLRVEDYASGALGASVTLDISGSCFDAGSSAQTLKQGTVDNLNQPNPTATPTPE
jgi:hypothetical protein